MSDKEDGLSVRREGTQVIAESVDVSGREDVAKLRKHAVGLGGVLFLTVTGAAPISAMLFNVPFGVGYGNGIGTPAGFMFATVVLAIFSVGYVAMARKKTTAGGFYAFISHGLGRELGLGAGLASVIAYSVFEASLAGGFAYFANLLLIDWFDVNVGWPVLAMIMVAIIAVLSYLDVSLSVAVLGVALILEVLSLVIFAFGVLFQGGADGIPVEAIQPANAFKDLPANAATGLAAGAAGIGLFFAFWSWVGFEMAPNYGEESKDPKTIVPRAMYISVIGLGIFYTFVSWMAIAGYSTFDAAALQAQSDPASFFLIPAEELVGGWLRETLSLLIVTGSFACGMAFHNTAARYFYSLGREGLIPRVFGKTHPKYHSPHTASALQSVIAALIVVAFAVISGTDDPTSQAYLQLYGLMAAMGVITILFIQALCSLAIAAYFFRHHGEEVHWWKTIIAPIISIVGQLYVLYLALTNMEFLGAGYAFADWLVWIDLAIFLLGLAYAFYLKSKKVDTYATIGRMIQEGL